MFHRIYVDNYRCFSNFEWRPAPLVVVGGRNGTGKSSLFEVIWGVASLVSNRAPLEGCFNRKDFTRWSGRDELRIVLDVATNGHELQYAVTIDCNGRNGALRIQREELFDRGTQAEPRALFAFVEGEVRLFRDDGSAGPVFPWDWGRSALATVPPRGDNKKLTAFREHMGWCWWVAPVGRVMDAEADDESPAPDVPMDNFVAWYRSASGDSIGVQRLNAMLSSVIEGFLGLRLVESGRDAKLLQVVFEARNERRKEVVFDFDELSDGQRQLIALYSLLVFGPVHDGVLMLDEPDNFIALREIQPWLRTLEDQLLGEDEARDGQVLLASHHPEVLNRLWEEHGVVFDHRTDDWRSPIEARALADSVLPPSERFARGTA